MDRTGERLAESPAQRTHTLERRRHPIQPAAASSAPATPAPVIAPVALPESPAPAKDPVPDPPPPGSAAVTSSASSVESALASSVASAVAVAIVVAVAVAGAVTAAVALALADAVLPPELAGRGAEALEDGRAGLEEPGLAGALVELDGAGAGAGAGAGGGGGGGGAGAEIVGGEIAGGAPAPKDHPSTLPGAGLRPYAPAEL